MEVKSVQRAEALAALWRQVEGPTRERVKGVGAAAAALRDGTLTEELRKAAEQDVHKLAGSIGMFGFHRGSVVASELEKLFQLENPPAPQVLKLVAELRRILRVKGRSSSPSC